VEVRLRPPTPADGQFLVRMASAEVAGEFNYFGADVDRLSAADVGAGRMMIELEDGTLIGDLGWFGVPYGPNRRSVAWKIGCTLDVPYRGRGYGSRAQRLLAEHLFATTPSNRVEADTDVENVAEQRALERAGFTRDGVVRGAQFRGGRWHDLLLYSLLRSDV
jgi:RimJ/RimL family protein N-acetyltransferase